MTKRFRVRKFNLQNKEEVIDALIISSDIKDQPDHFLTNVFLVKLIGREFHGEASEPFVNSDENLSIQQAKEWLENKIGQFEIIEEERLSS